MQISKQLIQDCKKGDRKAQQMLFNQCYSMLMGICLRYKNDKDLAKSSFNVGFFKILSNLDKYNPKVPFEAWSKRIMINTIIDEFRKSNKEKDTYSTDFTEIGNEKTSIDFNQAELELDAEYLLKFINSLPAASKNVFNLYAIEGYNHREIAEMVNISVGTSKWHLSNARKLLKGMITNSLDK